MRQRTTIIILVAVLTVIATVPAAGVAPPRGDDRVPEQHGGAERSSLDVISTTVGNAFLTNETPKFDVSGADSVTWAVYDYGNARVASGTETVGDGGDLTLPVDTPGYYELAVRADGDSVRRSFAVVRPDSRDLHESFFGIHAAFHKSLESDPNELITLVDMMGAEHVRGSFKWSEIEVERGVFEYPENYRDIVDRYERRGIRPLLILGGGNQLYFEPIPESARSGPAQFRIQFTVPPDQAARDAYGAYARELVTRYPELIYGVEVWNEYNLAHFAGDTENTPENYLRLLRAVYPAVEASNPDVTVAGGAIAADNDLSGWVDRIGALGGYEYVDTLTIHPYRRKGTPEKSDMGTVEEQMNDLQASIAEHSDDPPNLSITEIGWPTNSTQGERTQLEQGQYVPRTYVMAKAAGLEQVYYYGFKDQSWKLRGSGAMVRARGAELGSMAVKPGFATYATMTRALKGATYEGKDEVGDDLTYSYAFERDGEPVRAMWSIASEDVTVATDEPLTVTNSVGERQTLEPHDGEVYLGLDTGPIYVRGEVEDVAAGTPFDFEANVYGEDRPVPATFSADAGTVSANSVTFSVDGQKTSIDTSGQGRQSTRTQLDVHYAPDQATVESTLSIDGKRVGRFVSGTEGGSVSLTLGERPVYDGLSAYSYQFGDESIPGNVYEVEEYGGEQCWSLPQPPGGDYRRFLGIGIDDRYAQDIDSPTEVTVRYWDGDTGHFTLQYDSQGGSDWNTRFETHPDGVTFEGSGSWKTASFQIDDAKFANRQNFRKDFRISPVVGGERSDGPICVSRVTVSIEDRADLIPAPEASPATVEPAETQNGAGGTSVDREPADGEPSTTPASSPGFGFAVALVALVTLVGILARRER